MSNSSNNSSCLGGPVGLLTLLFVALKLTNYIDWSWWWVLSPLWISASFALGGFLITLIIGIIFVESRMKKNYPRRK